MASREVKRNTSKQIISYTLDPEGTDSYGTVKFPASKTTYGRVGFSKVLYTPPTELVNQIPSTNLTIISEERLDLKEFTGFKDIFSARYELPQNKQKYYTYNQSFESNNENPYGSAELGFTKVVFGPPQTSPGRYTITKALIDSGNDLKISYQIQSFNRRGTDLIPDTTPIGIATQFERIRKPQSGTRPSGQVERLNLNDMFANKLTETGRNNSVTHINSFTIKNEDMLEFDEWQMTGQTGTSTNSEVGYYVDGSWWDIQLKSN